MRHDTLVTVSSTFVKSQAEAMKNLLRANGIPCILGGRLTRRSGSIPVLEMEIKVSPPSVAAALQLLEGQTATAAGAGCNAAATSRTEIGANWTLLGDSAPPPLPGTVLVA